MLDWIVLGGGPHGTHLAIVLSARCGVPAGRLAVVDPHDAPMARWWSCVGNAGMRHLRSPLVHHLDLDPWGLRDHAAAHGFGADHLFAPYGRPSVALFRHHADWLETARGVGAMRMVASARALIPGDAHVTVETDRGALRARRVVLAIGAGDALRRPGWSARLLAASPTAPVLHVFDAAFDRRAVPAGERVAVVGGGLTASQLAVALGAQGCRVVLIRRRAPDTQWFDADPGWVGPKEMAGFLATSDPDARRRQIRAARHLGSVTPEAAADLDRAVAVGQVRVVEGSVEGARHAAGGPVLLTVDGRAEVVGRVVLATGLGADRPGGALVDGLVRDHGLRCASCGYPLVDEGLRWHPRVAVSGPLAELELGPVARNLAGARRAGERLAAWAG